VFRAGWAPTRPAARQMSSHRLLLVNGKPVNIPSINLRVGDIVTVKENKRNKPLFENFMMKLQNVHLPSWITLVPNEFSFKVVALPTMEEAQLGVDIRAIVEYFAR
jgi:small subunit ribosomal protein S4